MKILHIASFNGNIGDNASHIGFYKILNRYLENFNLTKVEIRKFYKNYTLSDSQVFDEKFVDYINTFDYCFIGGGGFLDYWVKESQTGTTIDIDPNLLFKIKTNLCFTSIGSNPHKPIPEGNKIKFKKFLEIAQENKNIKFAFRNDGSIRSISRDISSKFSNSFDEILDHGFFYEIDQNYPSIIKKKYVAINITSDQLEMLSSLRVHIDINNYHIELSNIINYIINDLNYNIVLIPHIYSDLDAISSLLKTLSDNIIRSHISVAPCIQGDNGANYLFSIYDKSEFVIGTRLHSNICSIALGKYTIGLIALDRLKYLYDFLNISDRAIVLEGNFSVKVIDQIKNYKLNVKSNYEGLKSKTLKFYDNLFLKV
jgi:polysaccharide pyruvyl transferase WcaK-like protein